jgi:2-desacetyl-2-hydroxyethyl bacteriochlorophyllide A dehydrogenase
MKAVVFKGARNLVLQDVPEPVPDPHEVLVKVKNVGICGSDLHYYLHGLLPAGYIMGHEVTGTVAGVGSAVSSWNDGDRVWVCPGGPCGQCTACLNGDIEACQNTLSVGIGVLPGGFAEYLIAPATMLLPLPEDVGMREGTLADPLGCAHHAVDLSEIVLGQSALVIGGGPIGLFVVQYLKSLDIEPVILSEPVPRRAELGSELGADFVLNPARGSIDEQSRNLTGGAGPDVVFECVGIPDTLHDSVALVRAKGKVVWVGICMEEISFVPAIWSLKRISIQFVMGIGNKPLDAERYLKFIQERQTDVRKVISGIIRLDEVPQAFERLVKPSDEVKIIAEL